MPPLVYIVMLNFNSWADSLECIASCCALSYPNYRIVLIDNGSDQDLSQELLKSYPQIDFLKNTHNAGYPAGCNLGIDFAIGKGADFIWLLNNDTVVQQDSLDELVTRHAGLVDAGILSPKIYHYQSDDIWSAGGYLTKMGLAVNYKEELHGVREVGFVTGCAMLIPADIFRQFGLLREEYFLNVEDWEICRRIVKGGKKIYVIGSSIICHKVSRSKKGGEASSLDVYYTARNRLYFIDEHYEKFQKLCIFTVFSVWWPVWLLKNFLVGNRSIVKPFIRGVLDYNLGVKGCSIHY